MIARAAGADALVLVLAGEGEVAAGELVRYLAAELAGTSSASLSPSSLAREKERRTGRAGRRRERR